MKRTFTWSYFFVSNLMIEGYIKETATGPVYPDDFYTLLPGNSRADVLTSRIIRM